MTGSSLSSAPDTIGGPLRDEAALERLFRIHFAALCTEAKSHLGEAAASAAPKVVEAAFRHAWDDREHITTEAELESFLHDAVRHTAARELSRRAGARHLAGASTGGAHHAAQVTNVDQAWAHLTRQLHPEVVRAEAQAYSEQLRHHAAEHVGDLSKPRSWKVPVILGIVAAAIVGAGMWWLSRVGTDRVVTRALSSSEARSLISNNGQTGNVTLDDSTRVTLAPGSKLTIPRQFPTEMRAVKIDGAARFVVAPGNARPFEIRAGDAAVFATGTTVVARAYPSDNYATIHLREGQATVRVGETERALAAGQTVLVENGGTLRDPTPAEVAEATNWTDRRVTISRQLRDVVQEINRWYGVDVKVPELKALDRPASIDAPLDSLRVAIAQVEKSADVKFGYEGQTMVFKMNKTAVDSVKK
jgi:ferric-dicitrate binding protein FerR (iron transport regulator)